MNEMLGLFIFGFVLGAVLVLGLMSEQVSRAQRDREEAIAKLDVEMACRARTIETLGQIGEMLGVR